MSKISIDYSSLANQITKKAYRLSDVKDKLETVAFDVVRFKDGDNGADLWQVQNAEDGDYIVALYDEDAEKTASPWSARLVKNASAVQISYKGDPLVSLSHSKLGIPREEMSQVESYLPTKLASNKKLVKSLLNELNDSVKQEVFKRYPELKGV